MTNNKEFGYSLCFKNGAIALSDQREEIVIDKSNLQSIASAIGNKRIKKYIPYNNDLIITYSNGYILLRDYQNFFNMEEFEAIKSKYLKQIKWDDFKVFKEKSKYIVLTSSLIMSILCGSKLGKVTTSNNDTYKYRTESMSDNKTNVTHDEREQVYAFKDEQVNNYMTNSDVSTDTLSADNTDESYLIDLDYGNNVSSEKLENAQKSYSDEIKKYAQRYGLDEDLVLAICTQERGTHSSTIDNGGGCGLMQIQVSAHPNGSSVYTTTFDSNNLPSNSEFTFNLSNYQTLDGNLEAGCALLRSYLNQFDGNIIAALYAYNSGNGNVNQAIKEYANDNNKTYDEVVKNYNNYDWHKYLNTQSNDYLNDVMQYFIDNEMKYYVVQNDGEQIKANLVSCTLNNEEEMSIKK